MQHSGEVVGRLLNEITVADKLPETKVQYRYTTVELSRVGGVYGIRK